MNLQNIMETVRRQVPALAKDDIILLLDAAEEDCISGAFVILENGAPEALDCTCYDGDGNDEVELCRAGESEAVLSFESDGSRVDKISTPGDEEKIVYINAGRQNLVVENAVLRPGEAGSIVPVCVDEALRAAGISG